MEVPGPQCTVAELKELVCDLTSIQPSSQKIIFKGIKVLAFIQRPDFMIKIL